MGSFSRCLSQITNRPKFLDCLDAWNKEDPRRRNNRFRWVYMQKFQSVWLPIRERLKRAGDNNKHANTNAIWAPLLSLLVLVVHPGGSYSLLNLIVVKKNSRFQSRHHFGKTLLVG